MNSHDNLKNHIKTNFALRQHHGYSLTELENMMPWERLIYTDLVQEFIKEEHDRQVDLINAQKDNMAHAQRVRNGGRRK